jgi:hypothetical protein
MKYLLVFLLLCPLLKAQSVTYDDVLEYSTLCYADSFLVHTHESKWNDFCYVQKGNMAEGYYYELSCDDSSHYEYFHKEPTFEGFVEFIKVKYRQMLQVK